MTKRARPAEPPSLPRTIVLDADGISKLVRRDQRTREMVSEEIDVGAVLVAPAIAVIQALVDRVGRAPIDRLLDICADRPIDRERVDLAAHLLRTTRTSDVPDALVAAEALLSVPSIILTSDPGDIERLLESDPRGTRVAVWAV